MRAGPQRALTGPGSESINAAPRPRSTVLLLLGLCCFLWYGPWRSVLRPIFDEPSNVQRRKRVLRPHRAAHAAAPKTPETEPPV